MRSDSTMGVSFSIRRLAVSSPTERPRKSPCSARRQSVARTHQRICGLVEIGIGHDDHVVLGAAEALGALAVHGRRAIDIALRSAWSRRRKCRRYPGGSAGHRQQPCHRDDIENARRQASLDHQFGQADRHRRIALGRLRIKALPQAMAGQTSTSDHARELKGVMPAPMPIGWRIEYMSILGPAPSVNSLFDRCGIPMTNSQTSRPRTISPLASSMSCHVRATKRLPVHPCAGSAVPRT